MQFNDQISGGYASLINTLGFNLPWITSLNTCTAFNLSLELFFIYLGFFSFFADDLRPSFCSLFSCVWSEWKSGWKTKCKYQFLFPSTCLLVYMQYTIINNDIRVPLLTYVYAKEIKEYFPELIMFIVDYMFDNMSLFVSIKLKIHSSLKYPLGSKCL